MCFFITQHTIHSTNTSSFLCRKVLYDLEPITLTMYICDAKISIAANPGDQLVIEPVRKEDGPAKRILKLLKGGC